MVSIEFIFLFLPVFMGIYAVTPSKFRSITCLFGTLFLSAWFSPLGIIPLGISVLTAYLGGIFISKFIEKQKTAAVILCLCVLINTAILLLFPRSDYFKSLFVSKSCFFPVFGTAVFTLHSISYCVDVFLKKIKAEKSFIKIAAYVGFFPCMTAGPVMNYGEMSETLANPLISSEKLVKGIKLLLIGLIEKLVFSIPLYQVWEQINNSDISSLNVPAAWLGIIVFAMSFYFEFAGFFNIGAGLCNMLGFDCISSINRPYISKSATEFPKRFNSGLYIWQRNYIQKPLQKKLGRIGAFIVGLFAEGLWLGLSSQTIIFSCYFVLILFMDFFVSSIFKKKKRILNAAFLNILILVGLPFLGVKGLSNSLKYIGIIFGIGVGIGENSALYILNSCGFLFVLGCIIMSGSGKKIKNKINTMNNNLLPIAMPVFEIIMLLIISSFLAGTSSVYLSFLY